MALQNIPENNNNLVRFYDVTIPTINTSQYSTGLHNGYLYRWRGHYDPIPILVGDTFTIYTNFDNDLVGANTIKVVVGDTVINDATQYVVSNTSWGSNNQRITLSIPPTNLTNNKKFNLAIVDGGDAILYKSNCFIVKQATEQNINNTHLIKFYNESDIYNYEWGIYDSLVDTPYTIRIPSSIREITYQIEKTLYKEATTGRTRGTRATVGKKYNFEFYYAVEEFHDAMVICSTLKYFEINGKEFVSEEYSAEFLANLNIWKAVITLTDVGYGRRITVCS